jgi:beta-aspartyl-peptidase (threonine type)
MTAEKEAAYTRGLEDALEAGFSLLEKGRSAIEAVLAATRSLEDNVLFNAGRGSVFAGDGSQEMDAAIMDGHDLRAGSVCAVRNIRNPIDLAYAVMTRSEHVMLHGQGAMDFARLQGIKTEDDSYFYSDFRHAQWKQMQGSSSTSLDHNVVVPDRKFGTVGAVACDIAGNLAAATSTGGMTNKQWGRIGDSPIIGAGTYANNQTCAISATGHGELFIRSVAAYDVSCLMEYRGLSLQQAMDVVVMDKLVKLQGEGGMIGVGTAGQVSMIFNCDGMYRGYRNSTGEKVIGIYR